MDFYTYTTTRDACSKAGDDDGPKAFYETALSGALAMQSAQFFFQLHNERDWEQARGAALGCAAIRLSNTYLSP